MEIGQSRNAIYRKDSNSVKKASLSVVQGLGVDNKAFLGASWRKVDLSAMII